MLQKKLLKEIRKYFELNENLNTSYHNFWDLAKEELSGKFMSLNAYIRKEEKTQFDNISSYLEKL